MRPFRAFWLETTGGSRIRIAKPEWFFEPPDTGGTFVVFTEPGAYVVMDYDSLASMTVEERAA